MSVVELDLRSDGETDASRNQALQKVSLDEIAVDEVGPGPKQTFLEQSVPNRGRARPTTAVVHRDYDAKFSGQSKVGLCYIGRRIKRAGRSDADRQTPAARCGDCTLQTLDL